MLSDKMGQEIEVGMWIIKPWDGTFDIGRVIKTTKHTFTFEYENWNGKLITSVCKVPERCLAVPEILSLIHI